MRSTSAALWCRNPRETGSRPCRPVGSRSDQCVVCVVCAPKGCKRKSGVVHVEARGGGVRGEPPSLSSRRRSRKKAVEKKKSTHTLQSTHSHTTRRVTHTIDPCAPPDTPDNTLNGPVSVFVIVFSLFSIGLRPSGVIFFLLSHLSSALGWRSWLRGLPGAQGARETIHECRILR